jgi:hypothetical protein
MEYGGRFTTDLVWEEVTTDPWIWRRFTTDIMWEGSYDG